MRTWTFCKNKVLEMVKETSKNAKGEKVTEKSTDHIFMREEQKRNSENGAMREFKNYGKIQMPIKERKQGGIRVRIRMRV